jgi:hypothetical protein
VPGEDIRRPGAPDEHQLGAERADSGEALERGQRFVLGLLA